jgi:hypothetical protein
VCYTNFLAGIFSRTELKLTRDADGSYSSKYEQIVAGVPKALSDLAICLAYVDALQAAAAKVNGGSADTRSARVANVGCGGLSATVVTKGRGRKLKAKITHGRVKGVHVACNAIGGRLAITVSTGSSKPLSKLVGSRLHLLVLRGKRDTSGGNLTFSYHKG